MQCKVNRENRKIWIIVEGICAGEFIWSGFCCFHFQLEQFSYFIGEVFPRILYERLVLTLGKKQRSLTLTPLTLSPRLLSLLLIFFFFSHFQVSDFNSTKLYHKWYHFGICRWRLVQRCRWIADERKRRRSRQQLKVRVIRITIVGIKWIKWLTCDLNLQVFANRRAVVIIYYSEWVRFITRFAMQTNSKWQSSPPCVIVNYSIPIPWLRN